MTADQVIQLKAQLIARGYTEAQANDMISILQANIDHKSEIWADTFKQIVSQGLNNDAVQKAIINFSEKGKLEIESQEKFHSFLIKINMWQKIYSILFIMIGGGVIFFLGKYKIIGTETCQILLTMMITLTVTDAISTFLKASKSEGE